MAVERWRPYLQRNEFVIKTDHHSLTYLEEQHLQTPMQRKVMARLMGLQFKIQYRKGAENAAADALSRIGQVYQLQAVSEVQPVWVQEVLNSYATDANAQDKLQKLALHSPDAQGFELRQGLIRVHEKIWVGANSALQTKLINAFHNSAMGGHSGVLPTYHRLKRLFSWSGMKQSVEDFVRQCAVCQQAKHAHTRPAGLLQPLPIPDGIWRDLTMDFVEGLPTSNGANVIMVVVDRLTKYAHLVPLKHPFTAASVAQEFLDSVVKLHGVPLSIVSDRDKIFISKLWKELFAALGTKLQFTTAYHPQTDGQSERVNQCIEMYLRCFVHDTPKQWRRWLPLAEFWYNTAYHSSLGMTPFKALYGCDPNLGAMPLIPDDLVTDAASLLLDRQARLDRIKLHLANAQNRMKLQADRHRSDKEYSVGDKVYLKLQPYAQSSVVNRPCPKLAFKYFGPYTILARVGSRAYKLALPASSEVHLVFHVSQLKEFVPDHTPVFHDLSKMIALDVLDTEPEAILDRRLVKKGSSAIPQGLVKWKNIEPDAATWEDLSVLRARFPHFRAWGQAPASAGGSVTPEQDQGVDDSGKT
jgi:hypothetical protein